MILLEDVKFYEKYFSEPRSKEELCLFWKCDDRGVRDNISKLQKYLNIVNFQKGEGWYITKNAADIIAYARQEYSRGIKSVAKAYKMYKRCGIDFQEEILKDIESEVI